MRRLHLDFPPLRQKAPALSSSFGLLKKGLIQELASQFWLPTLGESKKISSGLMTTVYILQILISRAESTLFFLQFQAKNFFLFPPKTTQGKNIFHENLKKKKDEKCVYTVLENVQQQNSKVSPTNKEGKRNSVDPALS